MFDKAVRVKLTLAFHGSVLPDGSNGGNPCGFIVTSARRHKIYDAADTALFGDMALIGEEGLDLAILPIGDYYTMGPDDACERSSCSGPASSCRSITTPFPRSRRTPTPGRSGSRTRRRLSPSSSSRASGSRFPRSERQPGGSLYRPDRSRCLVVYRVRQDYHAGDLVPFIVDGRDLGPIPAEELLP